MQKACALKEFCCKKENNDYGEFAGGFCLAAVRITDYTD